MYQAVRHVLNEHGSIIQGMPAMLVAANAFNAQLTELETLTQERRNVLSGVKASRDFKRQRLEESAFTLGKALVALAATNGDASLLEQSKWSRSALRYASIFDVIMVANQIWENAASNATALEAFGITSGIIDDLGLYLMDFQAVAASPRTTIVRKKSMTYEVKLLMKQIDELLRTQIDNIVVLFSESSPRFVSDYKGARSIIDLKRKGRTSPSDDLPNLELGAGDLDISPPVEGDDGE